MEEEEKDRTATRDEVYDLAYLPILQGTMESGEIASIPSAEELLEWCMFCPSNPAPESPQLLRGSSATASGPSA